MRDAQLAQRGYLIAGTEEFLEPFPVSMQAAETQLERLQNLAKGDNELIPYVDQLSDTFDQHRLHLQRTIEMRRTEEGIRISDELILLVKSGIGKGTMDKATRVTDAILELERKTAARFRIKNSIAHVANAIHDYLGKFAVYGNDCNRRHCSLVGPQETRFG